MTRGTADAGDGAVVRVSAPVGTLVGDSEAVLAAAREAAGSMPVRRTGPAGRPGPVVAMTVETRTAFLLDPDPGDVRDAVDAVSDGTPPEDVDGADAVAKHDPEPAGFPQPETGPLAAGRRSVLGPCGWVDPLDPAWWFVSSDADADAVFDAAADVGLLGRGRGDASADEPVHEAWATVRETDGDPVVVVNANEAADEPRADRTLLGGAPMAVLDGLAAVAVAVGADDAVLQVNESDGPLLEHVRAAVDAAAEDGRLPVVPQVVAGPDAYHAGEPTAALEALEGADRVEPRLQPPTPAEHGLYGRPTVVHTPRTVAQVAQLLREPSGFDADAADPGTRLVTVAGDVRAPATVELGPGDSLETVREAVSMSGSFRMACVGGVLGGLTAHLDVAPTAQSLRAAGLGTDGVVELLDERRCPVAAAGRRAKFAATENSGRCVPGREGTKQLTELVRDVYAGDFESDAIRELARVMRRSANCRLGREAPRPVTTAIDAFEPEFRAHANGRCSSGACTEHL